PEALVAAEEDRAAVGGHVLDVGGAGAGDQFLHLLAVDAHLVDVGVGARPFDVLAAAEDDRPVQHVGRVLVDAGAAGQPPQLRPRGPHRVDVVVAAGADRGGADEDNRLPVRRERGFVLVTGGGGDLVRRAAVDADRVEVARAPRGGTSLEEDDASVRRDLRAGVDFGAAGQPFLPRAVGADREDVSFAYEGDGVAVGRERRFGVLRVFRQLVEVVVFDREQPTFGRFRRQHFVAFFVDAVVFGDLREDDRPTIGKGSRGNGQCEEG